MTSHLTLVTCYSTVFICVAIVKTKTAVNMFNNDICPFSDQIKNALFISMYRFKHTLSSCAYVYMYWCVLEGVGHKKPT